MNGREKEMARQELQRAHQKQCRECLQPVVRRCCARQGDTELSPARGVLLPAPHGQAEPAVSSRCLQKLPHKEILPGLTQSREAAAPRER